MVQSKAKSVQAYLKELPEDRRETVQAVRKVVNDNLPDGYEEGMQYGMIGWYIPLARYPDTYNGQPLSIATLASQKNYLSLYLHGVYADDGEREWFERAYENAGKKLNMGKSCVRFKNLEDVPLDVIAEALSRVSLEEYLEMYERSRRR